MLAPSVGELFAYRTYANATEAEQLRSPRRCRRAGNRSGAPSYREMLWSAVQTCGYEWICSSAQNCEQMKWPQPQLGLTHSRPFSRHAVKVCKATAVRHPWRARRSSSIVWTHAVTISVRSIELECSVTSGCLQGASVGILMRPLSGRHNRSAHFPRWHQLYYWRVDALVEPALCTQCTHLYRPNRPGSGPFPLLRVC